MDFKLLFFILCIFSSILNVFSYQCPGKHESLKDCTPNCEKSCDQVHGLTDVAFCAPCMQDCLCDEGYARNNENGCVLEKDC